MRTATITRNTITKENIMTATAIPITTGRVAPIDRFFADVMGVPDPDTAFVPTPEQWADLDARVSRLVAEKRRGA